MVAADIMRAALVLLIPFRIPYSITWLYILVMLLSTVGQFFNQAYESILPDLASDEDLDAADSLMSISSFGSTAIGFAASGLIASQYPFEWAFYLDTLSFLTSATLVYFIRIKSVKAEQLAGVKVIFENLKVGLRCLFGNRLLRSLFLLLIPVMVWFGLHNAILLPFVDRALKGASFEYGIQESLTSVMFVIAALLMTRYYNRLREGQWFVVCFIELP